MASYDGHAEAVGLGERRKDIADFCSTVERSLHSARGHVWRHIQSVLCGVAGVPIERVQPDTALIEELGLDSLDLIDVAVDLEGIYGVKIQYGIIQHEIYRSLGDGFDLEGALPPEALEHLQLMMPEVPADRLAGGCRLQDIPSFFTAETLVRLVAWHLAQGDGPIVSITGVSNT
jgi:acyl carrier protein